MMQPTPSRARRLTLAVRHYAIRLHHKRCVVLLCCLLLFILALPFAYESVASRLFLFKLYVVVMLFVVWSLRQAGLALAINLGLGLLYFFLVSSGVVSGVPWVQQAGLVAAVMFLAGVMAALLRYVMDFSRVSGDKLCGAVALYILLAFLFADLYSLIESLAPGSFNFIARGSDAALDWTDYIYFSFTVLTSTGFGEITPASRLSRSVVIVQQVTGVMYVAFLVARLTELYPNRDR